MAVLSIVALMLALNPRPPPPNPPLTPSPFPPPARPPRPPPSPATPSPCGPPPPGEPPAPPPPPKPPGPLWFVSPQPPPSPSPPPLGIFWYNGHIDLAGLLAELEENGIELDPAKCNVMEQITYLAWLFCSLLVVVVWACRRVCFGAGWVMYTRTMATPCALYLPLFLGLLIACGQQTAERAFGLLLMIMQARRASLDVFAPLPTPPRTFTLWPPPHPGRPTASSPTPPPRAPRLSSASTLADWCGMRGARASMRTTSMRH